MAQPTNLPVQKDWLAWVTEKKAPVYSKLPKGFQSSTVETKKSKIPDKLEPQPFVESKVKY